MQIWKQVVFPSHLVSGYLCNYTLTHLVGFSSKVHVMLFNFSGISQIYLKVCISQLN